MMQLTERLWVGDSHDEAVDLNTELLGGVLNVAYDLQGTHGWPTVEYMQVGLIDGPGNPLAAYHAATLALATLIGRHRTLVYCHTGSRSVAVALMYLNTTANRGWDAWLKILRETVDDLPVPDAAHKYAFNKINWRLLVSATGD